MKLTRNILALAAITGIATTLTLLLHSSPAAGKGKPGGGGGDTNFAFVFEDTDKGLFLTTIDDGNRVQLTRTKGLSIHIEPRWSPDLDPDTDGYQGMIAYLRARTDARGLYVVNPDGSGDRFVTNAIGGGQFGGSPAWTPNGKEIVFEQSAQRIMAVDVATGKLRVLWEPGQISLIDSIAISPLGQLAFSNYGDIFVMDYSINAEGLIELDPTTIERVTDPDTYQIRPSFSPDGTYLAYTYDEYSGSNWRIVVQDLLTGNEIVVMEGLNGMRRVTWSPDGSQLATYNRIDGSHTQELIRITDWDDPTQRRFVRVTLTDRNIHEVTPDWKPDWQAN